SPRRSRSRSSPCRGPGSPGPRQAPGRLGPRAGVRCGKVFSLGRLLAIVGGLAAADQPAASSEDDDGSGTDADPAANAEASTARGIIGADGFGRGIAPVADLIGDHSAVGGLFGEVHKPDGAGCGALTLVLAR